MRDANIVVIGGGTGSFTLLDELKDYNDHISVIVCMSDDGGSTGVLRDELGVLPPGDVRQCLVALSRNPKMRDLFNYRFDVGTLKGHSFGNIFLTALEKTTGSFADAVVEASNVLRVEGRVIPATLDNVRLKMTWPDGQCVEGEKDIDSMHFSQDPRQSLISLSPKAKLNEHAIIAISNADMIIFAPGDLYTSLAPVLAVDGMKYALEDSRALKVYVSNLVTKQGQTDGLTVDGHVKEIERFIGAPIINTVIYNKRIPSEELAARYASEGSYIVPIDSEDIFRMAHYEAVGADLLGGIETKEKADILPVTRSYIRHDASKVVKLIKEVYTKNSND